MQRSTLLLGLLCGLLAGCSGGADGGKRVPVFHVTGKVTMSGGPLIGATVAFAPLDKQPTALGQTDDQGVYHLTTYTPGDGAAKGNYAIVVTKLLPASSTSSGGESHEGTSIAAAHGSKAAKATSGNNNLVPPAYGDSTTTTLKFTVEEKDNTFDIPIK